MSYTCVVIVKDLPKADKSAFEKSLIAQTSNSNIWINQDYYRNNEILPIDHEKYFIFEVCDLFMQADGSIIYSDVCQALLMPEGVEYTDTIMDVSVQIGSLINRVKVLGRIFACLESSGYHAEVFLGDSNAILTDYSIIKATADFSEKLILNHCLNNDDKPTIRFIFN